jgi:hypothetical protein
MEAVIEELFNEFLMIGLGALKVLQSYDPASLSRRPPIPPEDPREPPRAIIRDPAEASLDARKDSPEGYRNCIELSLSAPSSGNCVDKEFFNCEFILVITEF